MNNRLFQAIRFKLGDPAPGPGPEFEFECYKCSTGKKKLGINLKKRVYHCWRCGIGGPLHKLLADLGIDVLSLGKVSGFIPQKHDKMPISVPVSIPGFVPYGEDCGPSEIESKITHICSLRGNLTPFDIKSLGWGWSTEPYLMGRLIIPVTMDNKLVQYLARTLYPWITPKEKIGWTEKGWLPKTDILYGYDDWIYGSPIVLVEGIWDYLRLVRYYKDLHTKYNGFQVISLMGTTIGPNALGRLLSKEPHTISVFFDGDKPGKKATVRILKQISKRYPIQRLSAVECTPGKDPDELSNKQIERLPFIGAGEYLSR